MPATLTRNQMRLYQRERRARLKTGSWPTTSKDAPRPAARAIAPTPACAVPPASTLAIGGGPGRGLIACGPGYPLPPDQFATSPFGRWQENVETMLATLAAKNDAQEKRIAALEKTLALNETAGRAARAVTRAIGELFGVRLP
jgi:hypothetical protein